jgi:hypothetical protein
MISRPGFLYVSSRGTQHKQQIIQSQAWGSVQRDNRLLDINSCTLVAMQDTPVHLGDLIIGPEATHWSCLLVQDHLDSSGKLSLLGTCTAARDLVLVTAKHATLQWDVDNQAGSVAGRQAALATRGKLRTTLHLTASDSGEA